MIKGELERNSLKALLGDLKLLTLPAERKREILIRSLRMLKQASIKTANAQQSPDGEAWKPRKNGSAKMLRRLARLFNSQAEGNRGELFYKNKRTAQIAEEHQKGLDHEHQAKDSKDNNPRTQSDPCTKRQAKKLRDLGYVKRIGKKRKKLSISELQQTLTIAQAGAIIRKMQTGSYQSRQLKSWIIPTEKRPFLQQDDDENAKIVSEVISKYLEEHGL